MHVEDREDPGLLREELGIDEIPCAGGSNKEPRAHSGKYRDLLVQLQPHKQEPAENAPQAF